MGRRVLTEAVPATGTYLLEQRFRYDYAAPVRRLRHRLVVVPRSAHGGQFRLDHGLAVAGAPARVTRASDSFGNEVVEVRAPAVAEWIEFKAWALVGVGGDAGRSEVTAADAADPRLLAPTNLTRPDPVLTDAARELSARAAGDLEIAERASAWTYGALDYTPGVTGVQTTASDAVTGGRGVCQDYAHVMLAVCRAAGVRARYVSGHLEGEGGSHAWVEVVVRDGTGRGGDAAIAMAFDPTHNRRAERGYVTVAVGRDYADVAPTSGTFVGACAGVLGTSKRLRRTGPE